MNGTERRQKDAALAFLEKKANELLDASMKAWEGRTDGIVAAGAGLNGACARLADLMCRGDDAFDTFANALVPVFESLRMALGKHFSKAESTIAECESLAYHAECAANAVLLMLDGLKARGREE